MNIKIKLNFFSNNKKKFQPRTKKTVTLHVNCYDSCKCYIACEMLRFKLLLRFM